MNKWEITNWKMKDKNTADCEKCVTEGKDELDCSVIEGEGEGGGGEG